MPSFREAMCPAPVPAEIELKPADASGPAAESCLAHYYRELDSIFEDGFDPGQKAYAGTVGGATPQVYCVLAWAGGEAVGCGFLQWREGEYAAEIKRMWVASEARGQGLARAILRHLEDKARDLGFSAVRLDTNRTLTGAQRLYRSAGYEDIERYSDNPYAHRWFGKALWQLW